MWLSLASILLINPIILHYLLPSIQEDQFSFFPYPQKIDPFFHHVAPSNVSETLSLNRSTILTYLEEAFQMHFDYHYQCERNSLSDLDRFWPIMASFNFKTVKMLLYIFPAYSIPLVFLV